MWFSDNKKYRTILYLNVISSLEIEVILGLEGTSFEESYCHKITFESIIITRDIAIVFFLSKFLLIELDLYLNILLSIINIVALHVSEIYHIVELIISIELRYETVLLSLSRSINFISLLLIPTNSCLCKVYTTNQGLEGEVSCCQRIW